MNGFIFFTEGWGNQIPDPKWVAPIVEGSTYSLKSFSAGDCLLTWGHTCGDVWHAEQSGKAILILSGYISEFESGPKFESQGEAAIHLLAEFISADSDEALKSILCRIYGSFGIVFRDYVRDLTICVTDRVSSRPLWRRWQGSGWTISTHAAAVALSLESPRIDLPGIGAFLLYGGPLTPSRALFRDIYAIPPGSILRLGSTGGCDVLRWYQFRHRDDKDLSLDEWSKLVGDRLVRAATRIGRHCRAPAVFFSGGTDSRLTASAMKSAGLSPLLVTLGDSKNLEVRVAQLASSALRLNHIVIIRDQHWYLRTLPRAVYETGGHYVWTHGHFSAAAAMVRRDHGVDVFLLGDLCDAFSKLFCSLDTVRVAPRTAKEFSKVFDSIRLPLYRPFDRHATLSLFKNSARNEIEDALRFEIEQRFEEVCSLSRDPLIVGDLCFRWEAATSLPTFFMFLDLRSESSDRNLMFDRDVHELLERLPSKMRNENNLGAHVIQRLQTRAAWVMNSNSLLPMIWPMRIHKISKRMKPILGNVRRFLIGSSYRTTGSWPHHRILYVSDPQWRQYFERILGNTDLFDEKIFEIGTIRRYWEDFSNGNLSRCSDIEKLVQIGLLSRLLREGATNLAQENLESNDEAPPAKFGERD